VLLNFSAEILSEVAICEKEDIDKIGVEVLKYGGEAEIL